MSLAEIVWAKGDIQQALAELPPIVPTKVHRQIERLLQPWPQGRYTSAYQRSGGILNLFTPPWGEAQDEIWHKMLAEWRAQTFPDEQPRRAGDFAGLPRRPLTELRFRRIHKGSGW